MKNNLIGKLSIAVLTFTLMSPIALVAQDHHDDHRYFDKHHNDYHNWNDHEDRAYHMYWEQRHRPYVPFDSLRERDRERYWAWRHDHNDALLKIEIR